MAKEVMEMSLLEHFLAIHSLIGQFSQININWSIRKVKFGAPSTPVNQVLRCNGLVYTRCTLSTPNQRQMLSNAVPVQHSGKKASLEIWQMILSNLPNKIHLQVVSCIRAILFLDMVTFITKVHLVEYHQFHRFTSF